MKKTEQKVLKFIDDKNLIGKNDKILIALSGGPDSVFLFYFLNKYKRRFRISLGAVHINHKLRGADSDNDQKFCKELCERFSVPFYTINKDVKSYARKKKLSLEEAGREIRYTEFSKTAKGNNFTKIATAHNCSDNAETVFLNLIKGTGVKGLAGIPYQRGNIIRPLLILTKSEILKYLEDNGISFRTDASNLQSDFDRNFIRNELFPLIKNKLNAAFEEKVFNASSLIRSFSNQFEKIIDNAAGEISEFRNGRLKISIAALKKFDGEIAGYIFKVSIEKKFGISLNFKNLKDILSLIQAQTGTQIILSKGITALRERNEIVVLKKKSEREFANAAVEIRSGQTVKLNSKKFSIVNSVKLPLKFSSDRNREYISADNIEENFLIRKWKPGDRFHPIGLKGTKKLSDFLNEQKISSVDKKNQLVLTNGGKIVWVIGLRLDERFKITDKTNRIFELCLK